MLGTFSTVTDYLQRDQLRPASAASYKPDQYRSPYLQTGRGRRPPRSDLALGAIFPASCGASMRCSRLRRWRDLRFSAWAEPKRLPATTHGR